MNPVRIGFVLRLAGASRTAVNSKNVVRDTSALQKCFFSTSRPVSSFRQMADKLKTHNATLIAACLGIGAVSIYSFKKRKNFNKAAAANSIESSLATNIPDAKPTRRIRGSVDNNKLKLTLYQYQSCPFCCKVRAYLDFKGLSYDVVEVNSLSRKDLNWSKYKKVPILVCEAEGEKFQLVESAAIISSLETFLEVHQDSMKKVVTFYPSFETVNSKGKKVLDVPNKYHIMFGNAKATFDKEEVQKWREWTDNVLVHTISPNIYRTPSESLKTFKYFSKVGEWEDVFSSFDRNLVIYIGATAMYFVSKTLKKRHNLSDDVRESLYSACNTWVDNLASKKGAKFAGGSEPNLADLSVYGVLSAMEGTDAFKDVIANTKLGVWFQDVKQEVNNRAGKRIPLDGANDGKIKDKIVA